MPWQDLARRQHGVVTSAQLTAAGLAASTLSRMCAAGELMRLVRGVYMAGGAPWTFAARLWAAVVATGGSLCWTTAGQLWGVWEGDSGDAIEVVLPHRRRVAVPGGVVVHRQVLPGDEIVHRSGLPTTSRSWTVLDLLATQPFPHATRLADRALQQGWLAASDVATRLRTQPHRPGNRQLRLLLAGLGDGAAAESERRLHRLLRGAGIDGWVANHPVWSAGELIAVVDVALPLRRIAIEVDGMAYHVDVDRFRRDRRRQNALVALGWTVLRFTWSDLTERPDYVVATLRRVAA